MPVKEFPDSDWKQLRKVYEAAFSRYCETSLEEARAVIEDASLVPSDRFDALCRKVKGKQKELNSIFYTFNFSHSNALMILLALYNWKVITPEELELFTPTTQARIRAV